MLLIGGPCCGLVRLSPRQSSFGRGTQAACLVMDLQGTEMRDVNFQIGWCAIFFGLITGAGVGLFFHDENWLGGYASWRRRLIRLGHISFFGTGFLNLAFALSVRYLGLEHPPAVASLCLVGGALFMPTVCFLSAWRISFRHLFVIPVGSLIVGVADFLWQGLFQ